MSRPIPVEQMVKEFKSRHTTSHLSKIDNFSLLKKHNVKMVESSVFTLGGYKWKLIVYPNGKNDNGYVSIFLVNQVSVNAKLQFHLFVISQLRQTWQSSGTMDFGISSTSQTRGALNLTPVADLRKNGYLIEDCCILGVEFYRIGNPKSGTAECLSLIEKPHNHRVTWKMTRFSSFEPEKIHFSDDFIVGSRRWRIKVHPRKDKPFSVYLSGEEFINNVPRTNTFAKFKLRVLDQVKRKHLEKTYSGWIGAEPDESHGFADFMPFKSLDTPFLVKDHFYVGVDFELISITKLL
ncbi:unnamed protein product [Thlaspi arvense]|uniref:MATH domain-containing protein n=1 Tax=Thlaspi arvense TaxID=13288 RepID=A0AAU9SNC7_THLAR|nr:unnamed protein product [Thlaspi arvense]